VTDDKILEVADSIYRRHSINAYTGYVRDARLEFARTIEAMVRLEIAQKHAQSAQFATQSEKCICTTKHLDPCCYWARPEGHEPPTDGLEGAQTIF
jgi:hypothetical protein